ncbi:MarR family winged helix-turn-helix transcriptional regulator [Rugosimonospora acidiphila]|uniref:MarR family winged helix-turn-helix transcriptional regulator n=1 Tax=Rugosimonospora acidiphila TaxID=556531 RepID=A0ABP9RNX8_9ACTN
MTDPTAAWSALLRVHGTLVPALDRELQRTHGLPLTWYDVLAELDGAPRRRMTMSELGNVAMVSRSRVSRVVDELVAAGLVAKESNPTDGRSAYAVVTTAGRRRLRQARPSYLAAIERGFTAKLSAREAEMVARALGKVLAAGEPDGAGAYRR